MVAGRGPAGLNETAGFDLREISRFVQVLRGRTFQNPFPRTRRVRQPSEGNAMNDRSEAACTCTNCPGSACTCGCQSAARATALAERTACACAGRCGCDAAESGCLCSPSAATA